MITQKKTCVFEVFFKRVVAAACGSPLLSRKLVNKLIGFHLLGLAVVDLPVQVFHELKVCGKEDIRLPSFDQIIFKILFLMRFFELFRNDWCSTTSLEVY